MVHYCKRCTHPFSVITDEESYKSDYFSEDHENWFNNPNFKLFNKFLKECQQHNTNKPTTKPMHLLDVGCGKGQLLHYFLEKKSDYKLYGIDLYKNEHETITFYTGDINTVSFDRKFDIIISTAVIEHVNDPHRFIDKLTDLLENDGKLILMTINSNSLLYKIAKLLKKLHIRVAYDRLYHHHHHQHWSCKSLKTFLENKNLTIEKNWTLNCSLKSLDFPSKNPILQFLFRLVMVCIYVMSNLFGEKWLQVISCRLTISKNTKK